jgi:hypothetical protein
MFKRFTMTAAAFFFAFSPAQADELEKDLFNEVGDDLMVCASVYRAMQRCAEVSTRRKDHKRIAHNIGRVMDEAIEMASMFYKEAGVSDAAIESKAKFFLRGTFDRLQGSCRESVCHTGHTVCRATRLTNWGTCHNGASVPS